VGLSVLGLRGLGTLESAELAAYDWFFRLRPAERLADPRILLVAITEHDINAQGTWPLPDGVLARAVEALARYQPRAIGLDIYRDVPVPPGSEQLQAVLKRDPRVIGVRKFGDAASQGIPSHPALRGTDRVGFNDILVDPGGTVRRGLLFLDDGSTTAYAFALRLAILYLQVEGATPHPDPLNPSHLRLGRTTIHPLEPNDGAYVGADARGYQFLLDFRGANAPFPSVTLTDLLSDAVEPAAIRDKVVVIGVTAESVKDNFYTPYSRGLQAEQQSAGIAIHMHIVSQLLRIGLDGARPMATLPQRESAVWILMWSAAGGILGLRVRSPWRFSLTAGGGLAGLGLIAFLAFLNGWWFPFAPAAAAWLATAAVVTAYVSYRETAQRAALMRLFSSNVSREVAESIWQQRDQFLDGGRPRSERLVVTALFTDLAGFTSLSEMLGPEALMDWLNEYMGAMAGHVSQHGGVIRQFAGDSIVAIFGVPVARRSEADIAWDAVSAVACALAMETTLRDLNRRWAAESRPTTGMRVGVFTGAAVAGTLGSAERSEYVVVGDTVNTASRLESFDKSLFPPDPADRPCRILIGETTWGYLGNRFATERVGDVILKGKEQAVGVYRVLGWAPGIAATLPKGEQS
jgi:adenylate cyclase